MGYGGRCKLGDDLKHKNEDASIGLAALLALIVSFVSCTVSVFLFAVLARFFYEIIKIGWSWLGYFI